MVSPHPSVPPSEPSPLRRLGTGAAGRPVRAQMIVALVALLVLIAVPLYLWRRPRAAAAVEAPDAAASAAPEAADAGSPWGDAGATAADGGSSSSRVTVADARVLKCMAPGVGKVPVERCDRLPFFEDGLVRAIRENPACAPTTQYGGTVSFVMSVDFKKKKLHVYAGKSSTIKKGMSRDVVRCVRNAMPVPDWATVPHQHASYDFNVVATYAPAPGKAY